MQPRILILSGVLGDTRRYRTVHLYEQLCLLGVDCTLSHISDPQLRAKARQANLVIIHRAPWDSQVAWLVDEIHQRRGLVIQDTDDLIFDPDIFKFIDSPDFADPIRARLYQDDLRRNRRTLQACDAVVASTNFLAERARSLGKLAWVHRNAFSLEMLAISEQAYRQRRSHNCRDFAVIGYASGTPTHNRDFAQVKPALQAVLRSHPHTELHLIGRLDPGSDWGALANRIYHHPLVPWRELPFLLADFDINLAPLHVVNPFGQSKSEIKYVEAALLRVPTIASPTTAFQVAIRPGENGLLAAADGTSVEDWLPAVEMLVRDPQLRRDLGESAYCDVTEHFHPLRRAAQLAVTLQDIAVQQSGAPLWAERCPVPTVPSALPVSTGSAVSCERSSPIAADFSRFQTPPQVEHPPSLLQLGWHNLRHRGLSTLLMQAWVFFRRLVAPLFPYHRHV